MADLSAKVRQARQAGYSDDEILSHLSKDPTVAGQVQKARGAGYRPADIVSHLSDRGFNKALGEARKNLDVGRMPLLGGQNEGLTARAHGAMFGWADEATGAVAAGKAAVQNLFAPITGKPAGYTPGEAYRGYKQGVEEWDKDYARRHPVQSVVENIAGGMWLPGAKYIGGAKGVGQMALRSARVGVAAGALAGAGNAKDGERITKGVEGAAVGGALGGAAPLVVRALGAGGQRAVEAAKEVGSRAKLAMGGETAAPTAQDIARAGGKAVQYVDNLSRPSPLERMTGRGVAPDALSANQIEAAGKPITAAEALGRRAMGQLKAVSRREGTTGDELESTLRQRIQEQPDRVLGDMQEITGLNPEFVNGDHTAQMATLRRQAAPIYDEAYAQPAVDTPELQDLMRRPSVQKAMKKAVDIAREEGRTPEELGFVPMDSFDGYTIAKAPEANVSPADLGALRTGAKPPSQGPSLLEFIGKNGGLADLGGELRTMDAETWHRAKPFLNRLIRADGHGEEAMAQKAWEAGYFPDKVAGAMDSADNMQRVTADDLRAAIADEMAGKTRFARPPVDPERAARLGDLEQRMGEAGVNPRTAKMQDVRSALGQHEDDLRRFDAHADGEPLPMSETDIVAAPRATMHTLDYVKRGLDDVMSGYKNPLTGRLELDTEGRAVIETLQKFRSLIAPEGSKYAEALSAGGEPLRQEEAYRSAAKVMQNSTPYRLFRERLKNMGSAEREALKAGWVRDTFEAAQSGRLKLKDTQLPNYTRKVIDLVGRDKGLDLVRRLRQEIEIAQNARSMMPSQGSHTFDMLAADKDREAATSGLVGAAKTLARGKPVQAAIQAVASPFVGAFRGAQAPIDQATRNEVGRLLQLSPSELEAVLGRHRATARPPSYRSEAIAGNLFGRVPLPGRADK